MVDLILSEIVTIFLKDRHMLGDFVVTATSDSNPVTTWFFQRNSTDIFLKTRFSAKKNSLGLERKSDLIKFD